MAIFGGAWAAQELAQARIVVGIGAKSPVPTGSGHAGVCGRRIGDLIAYQGTFFRMGLGFRVKYHLLKQVLSHRNFSAKTDPFPTPVLAAMH